LLESNDSISREAVNYFEERFGVPREAFAELRFFEKGVEIWASAGVPPSALRARRPAGLRALRRRPDGLKPTSSFLMTLDRWISRARFEISRDDLLQLLLGRRLSTGAPDGYVALSFRGHIVGCGRAHSGALQALIPTGRRRELLDVLAKEPRQADL
jgi:NOL1/NOP2/fmu family ribosome biogenesis protein